ncbi:MULTISPECIES: hypothetical protein [Actinoplanes]|uniref:hypothetical protein n=1 Tax=Actinoplanes TaxID=1865 RepID=UPI0005F2829E|nr:MULTISPECIES: hypothetical protein [Actinoplanes]GLY02905.1 hypothetical protein Acsp01_32840 [Actinoplanes sp. NBRC 101535]
MSLHRPRVLDASAVVELLQGHPDLMFDLDRAAEGKLRLVIPMMAQFDAQVTLALSTAVWDRFAAWRGVTIPAPDLHRSTRSADIARERLELGLPYRDLTSPQMIGHVVHEATVLDGIVVTRYPPIYLGHHLSTLAI